MVANGIPVRQVMRKIGYADSSADTNQKLLTGKEEFKQELAIAKDLIAKACTKNNVTIDRMVQKVSDGLDARRKQSTAFKVLDVPDHDAQVKWWDRGALLLGIKKDETDGIGSGRGLNVNLLLQIVNEARESRGLPV